MPASPYDTLGVATTASRKEVADAYKALAQIYHPDRYNDAPERVRAEAERKMKELTEAYTRIRSGEAMPTVEVTVPYTPRERRTEWPKATRPDAAGPAVDADGVVATPLAPPTAKYSLGQWNLATTRWTWSDAHYSWICAHGRDMCGACGATPDAISVKAGVARPPMQWRRAARGLDWVCVSHHRADCPSCGRVPTAAADVIDIRPRRSAKQDDRSRRRRVAWS